MSRQSSYILIFTVLIAVLLPCTSLHQADAQSVPVVEPQVANKPSRPISLEHLYWHFLMYQNHLDTKAAQATAQGKDGSGMRNLMQQGLGFSDADYAPIRISSVRLASEIRALDAKAAAIRVNGSSASNQNALMALTVERETDISSEISYIKTTLRPEQFRLFEAFLVKLFSPSNAISQLPHPNEQPAVGVVQK